MFICPICGAKAKAKDVRPKEDGALIWRRRECARGHRFDTYETFSPDATLRTRSRAAVRARVTLAEQLIHEA